jgi:predicted nucleic acid-binding protein
MKVLLDTDVLMDVATGRHPHVIASARVIDWCEDNPGSSFVAWHTVANLYYLLRRQIKDAAARQFIHEMLDYAEVVATGSANVKHALALHLSDFEDALQAAAAVQAGADVIVTPKWRALRWCTRAGSESSRVSSSKQHVVKSPRRKRRMR